MVRHLPVNREVPGSNPAVASFFAQIKRRGMLLVELGRGPAAPRVRRRVPLVGPHAMSSTFTQHKRKKMYLTILKARVFQW